MILILLYVLTELGYVLKCQVKQERKHSLENALVEKGENSTCNKWLNRRIVLYNQSIPAFW